VVAHCLLSGIESTIDVFKKVSLVSNYSMRKVEYNTIYSVYNSARFFSSRTE